LTSSVGVIANPAAGRDIRRLVAQGRVVSDQEKANILRRVFAGLAALGVERVFVMPERVGLARMAAEDVAGKVDVTYPEMSPEWDSGDSTVATRRMVEAGVDCLVTLGGDGTNRVVAKACGDVPIVAISTGTNNVFPQLVEGTIAGLAAGAVATGLAPIDAVCKRSKRLDILVDGALEDIALVDAAVSTEIFTGARAIWDLATVREVYLTRASPASIGISSIGAQLRPTGMDEPVGLYIRIGGPSSADRVLAPVGPGMVREVPIAEWSVLESGERRRVPAGAGTVALDGEREVSLLPDRKVEVELNRRGPLVVQIESAMATLAGRAIPVTPTRATR
jgi:predicted polyphosphate/ATP-dependent NAD kinase